MRVLRHEFDTWDAAEALEAPRDAKTDASINTNNSWCGSSIEEARDWARHGWEAGVAGIDPGNPILGEGEVPSFEFGLGEEGVEPDIGAFLSGEPECMGDMRRVPIAKPLVRIGIDMSVSSFVASERMMRVGKTVVMLVQRLRSAGFPTSVDVCFSVTGQGGARCDTIIHVQDAGQPIHEGILAFFVGNPSSLRRAMFALCETYDKQERTQFGYYNSFGYGHPANDALKADYDEWAPNANNSDATIDAWVREVLDRRVDA